MPPLKTGRHRPAAVAALTGILGFAPLWPGQATLSVTDSLGRAVALPPKAERIVSLQPEITRLIIALGAGDKLIGLDFFLRSHDEFFKVIYPRQDRLPLISMANYNVNAEVLTTLRPDVIFGAPEDRDVIDALAAKVRAPIAAFSSMGRFDGLLEELRFVGRLVGRDGRAAEIEDFFRKKTAAIRSRLDALAPSEKPRVFLSFWNVFTNTPVFYEPVNVAGGINVAEGALPSFAGTMNAVVPVEKILAWAPDIILLHGNYPPGQRMITVASVLSDRRLTSLQAVAEGRVRYTYGFWNWWDLAQVLVETTYLAKLFHPERFKDVDMTAEGNAIYKFVYGIDGGYTALCRLLRCDEWDRAR